MNNIRIFDDKSKINIVEITEPFQSAGENKVGENWEAATKQNPKIFNGNQLVVEITEDRSSDDAHYIVTPVKYAQALASAKGIIPEKFVVAGVASVVITQDNKVIIGSRDAARDKSDPKKYPLQTPNGGMDSDTKQMEALKLLNTLYQKTKPDEHKLTKFSTEQQKHASLDYRTKFGDDESNTDFKDFLLQEGLREVREELYDFRDDEIKPLCVIGTLTHTIGSKAYLKGGIPVYRIKYTFDELKALRDASPPQDLWEMTLIEGLSLTNITDVINDGFKIRFDGETRQHLQPYLFHSLHRKMNDTDSESMKSGSRMSPIHGNLKSDSDPTKDTSFTARELNKSGTRTNTGR